MDPFYAIPAFIVFTIAGIVVFVRIVTSPIRGAKHIRNAVSSKATSSDKEESLSKRGRNRLRESTMEEESGIYEAVADCACGI
jgi:uncharacterized membrane protein